MSNLSGGSAHELVWLLSVVSVSFAWVRILRVTNPAVELLAHCLSLCLALTLLCDWLPVLVPALAILAVFVALLRRPGAADAAAVALEPPAVLSVYRGGMMLATCISILAVDFRAFPRRFAKTETFGFSLMDLGVGSFVFSAGLVSRSSDSVARAALDSAVVIGLGVARYVVTTLVGYQLHVSEYGTHWNFFLSLGLLLFVARATKVASWRGGVALVVGCFVACLGQMAFGSLAITEYILSAPRVSWVSHNREGLVSLVGFFALLLWGADVGKLLRSDYRGSGAKVVLTGTAFAIASTVIHLLVQNASRRMANAAYVCFVAALNCMLLASLQCFEWLIPHSGGHNALSAISRHQLPVFVLGNLCTGLVNLSVNTLALSDVQAFHIVLVYILVVGGAALMTRKK